MFAGKPSRMPETEREAGFTPLTALRFIFKPLDCLEPGSGIVFAWVEFQMPYMKEPFGLQKPFFVFFFRLDIRVVKIAGNLIVLL